MYSFIRPRVFLISDSLYVSHIHVFDSLPTGDKENTSEKPRHISPAGFQGGKLTCLDCQEIRYTHTETFPRTGDTCVQPHARWERFHTTLQQWISSGGASQTVVLWQICPMATWWTCSDLTTPPAPQFLLPWRESIRSHRSPRSLPLLAPASSAPSPVPWSKQHKLLQD